jgi:hypothetical protein
MENCEIILQSDYDKAYKGTIQISSNDRNNPNDNSGQFQVNISSGLGQHVLVLDSIIFMNDMPNINLNNFIYTLNGTIYSLPIGQYDTMLDFANIIAAALTASAGHPISVVNSPTHRITMIGTLGFTDVIIFDKSISRILGYSSTTITLVDATPVLGESFVPSIPLYTRWVDISVVGLFEDLSYTYGTKNRSLLSCVPIPNFGEQIDHREVEYRPLTMLSYVSSIQVRVYDEYGKIAPLGKNSLVINLFYK